MPPEVVASIAGLRARLADARGRGTVIGLVPTMGALHAGHLSLIERARQDCGVVVVSVFVNPTQFDRREDLERYPRSLDSDVQACERAGVDLVFAPDVDEMYRPGAALTIDVGHLGDHLCGRFRPGHFNGVATVVMKLLQIAGPHRAYFGEKDAQQLAIIRRLVEEFDVPVEVVGLPAVREPDGLALSSRNQRLSPAQRQAATGIYRALDAARQAIDAGERDAGKVRATAEAALSAGDGLRLEYVEVVEPAGMQPVDRIDGPVIVAAAAWAGEVRLIDSVRCGIATP
ncbi:MAG: pantoate--beta-alanine ligase [Acidimicrobiia bacterium]|nr:pantoate--beta-alanine ligase [Acidimicrobiia bacterium]